MVRKRVAIIGARPQRAGLRLLPRRGRARGRGARAPRRRRRRGGDRGVPSRLPQLDRQLHGQPAAAEGDRRPAARRARPARSSSGRSRTSCRWPTGATSSSAAGSSARRPRSRASRRATPQRLPAYYAMLDARGRRAARPGAGDAAERWATARRDAARARWQAGAACAAWPSLAQARRARPVHQVGAASCSTAGSSRDAAQGRVRLRRGGRQLRQPVHAGLGLCAAAPRVRRSQRQEGRLGPRGRRHGRDHAGDGRGLPRVGVEIALDAPVARVLRRRRPRRGRAARRAARSSPRRRASSPTSTRSCSTRGWSTAGDLPPEFRGASSATSAGRARSA